MRLLATRNLPATFFMPAVSALLHPDEVRSYIAAGHELGIHGWIHERNQQLRPADQRELAWRATDTPEKLASVRPVGIRTTSWAISAATLSTIRHLGLRS